MNEIVCPNCHKAFKVDKTGYAHILKQVRDNEFDKQLNERMRLVEKEKRMPLSWLQNNLKSQLNGLSPK